MTPFNFLKIFFTLYYYVSKKTQILSFKEEPEPIIFVTLFIIKNDLNLLKMCLKSCILYYLDPEIGKKFYKKN